MRFIIRLIFVALALVVIGAAGLWYLASRGFSARAQPSRLEETVALRLRSLATPREAKAARNPLDANPANVREGMEHFADHCAICHANNGSGDSELGAGLYPKPPDLRAARTQSLTDGEIFYIIENGVRFTGMPAFGGEHVTKDDSWKLVQFIRHLPSISAQELAEMSKLNPAPPGEQDEAPAGPESKEQPKKDDKPAPHTHKHKHK
jgi:mono/diheme cytochrome c family protein